jgi:hypothetical protein
MSLERASRTFTRGACATSWIAMACGVAATASAALTLVLPGNAHQRLVHGGADDGLSLLVALLAGAVVWSFAAIALAVGGGRGHRASAWLTIAAGVLGLLYAVPYFGHRFGVFQAAAACGTVAGAALIGGGVLAVAIAARRG